MSLKLPIEEESKIQHMEFGMMDSMKSTTNSDSNQMMEPDLKITQSTSNQAPNTNRISEYQNKLASIK
jgi:hypothetical protein